LAKALLKTYGFEPIWKDAICQMVQNVLTVELPGNSQDMVLASIHPSQRMNEMEFYFPVRSLSLQTIRDIFIDSGGGDFPVTFPEQMEKLTFSPAKGFMKGFIDLVFQHQGQFYIVDWKSNYLGPNIDAYQRKKLTRVMRDSFYPLQYQIYILALQQYLRLRIPGYRYETDFGGVFYLFCRGIDPQMGAKFGIFHDRPSPGFIHELEKALIPNLT
jgi:exodeoxyribonuclease V beta subunit